ncbi:Clp protease N-terminal domain-containing protein [Amycolatopsis sp. YIM 10]|uniref:Clp protease N-terminal domain-containing protein n=1 Tax=Amycolatopsis sp. YIM 10 TaxID=2653857 RepID=UPI00128FCFB1|nr:Clp protease N-terminal domain-containing protein [Amycolatopsis sp. YIM 10]QFU94257.1 ATP-dependent Clp protease ATP-binding subunit ClpC1 [Amycolatopsis sp. YIM 10]
MFERFTAGARLTVVSAQEAARESGTGEIGPEHLLIALRGNADGPIAELLDECLPDQAGLTAQFAEIRRRGGLSDADTEALEQLGIDVFKIVDAVERSHGEYALAGRGPRPRRRFKHLPFSRAAKSTLERSLREAVELGDRHIGSEHLLLALATQPGLAADQLAAYGITSASVRLALSRRRTA